MNYFNRENLRIALIGYGKVGRLIDEVAKERGHQVVAKITTRSPEDLTEEALQKADICIDFSHPDVVIENIKKLAGWGQSIVVGTTGWYNQLYQVKSIVEKNNIGFLYGPNFSVGMLLFMNIVRHTAKLMNKFPEFDMGIFEVHHNQKADAPSGTAEALAEIIVKEVARKSTIVYDLGERESMPLELQIASLRCGNIPGNHTIYFDGLSDTIELKHTARNRLSFARGAIAAAEWLHRKKGFYTMEDMLHI